MWLPRWMSKEPAEIFERAAEQGFIRQLKLHSTVSQYGQLKGALSLDGTAVRQHFEHILHNQVHSKSKTIHKTGLLIDYIIGAQWQIRQRI